MRIGFDARMITHPGIGRYISSLLPELFAKGAADEFVLFGDEARLAEFSRFGNVSVKLHDAPVYSMSEQFSLPYLAEKLDVLHVPHFNVPLLYGGKLVVTIHDLIYLLFPESLPHPAAKYYARFMIEKAVRKARAVIAVSEHTKNDLLRLFGSDNASKVRVVYEASDKKFRRVEDKARIADALCRYRLSERIILFVGSVKPHKNIPSLLKVFNLLKEWGVPHQLVICGRWDKKEEALKDRLIDRNIKYIGEIPMDDLVTLYSVADVLVHLSLYEGFGLTVLEAMQCGTPVVVSDSSSLPEVVGSAAFKVSPRNIEQTADVIYNILVNPRLKEGMSEAGMRHAGLFSWGKAALETLEIYYSIA